MVQVNAMGEPCPFPVVKTKKALQSLAGPGVVETLVDNEIAVENLTKMARQNGCAVTSIKLAPGEFKVTITAGEGALLPGAAGDAICQPTSGKQNTVVVLSSDQMGGGSDELGKTLLKGFLYALGQQETLPRTLLFYNGGAALTCADSAALEDLKSMEAQGVEILTCGTCLNFYGLSEQLRVGEVTNMYTIAEKLTQASLIIRP